MIKTAFAASLAVVVAFLFMLQPAFAGFSLQPGVFRMDELSQARDEARIENVPIAFMYSHRKTKCGLASAASKDVMKEFGDYFVIVFVSTEDQDEWQKLPMNVARALNSTGKFIPKTAVMDPGLKKVLATVPYKRNARERRKLLRDTVDKFAR